MSRAAPQQLARRAVRGDDDQPAIDQVLRCGRRGTVRSAACRSRRSRRARLRGARRGAAIKTSWAWRASPASTAEVVGGRRRATSAMPAFDDPMASTKPGNPSSRPRRSAIVGQRRSASMTGPAPPGPGRVRPRVSAVVVLPSEALGLPIESSACVLKYSVSEDQYCSEANEEVDQAHQVLVNLTRCGGGHVDRRSRDGGERQASRAPRASAVADVRSAKPTDTGLPALEPQAADPGRHRVPRPQRRWVPGRIRPAWTAARGTSARAAHFCRGLFQGLEDMLIASPGSARGARGEIDPRSAGRSDSRRLLP